MLTVAQEREVEGDVAVLDLGHGVPVRTGVFDGAISISAVQWLCNADRKGHEPRRRLRRFFDTLYSCLARGARAVLQVGGVGKLAGGGRAGGAIAGRGARDEDRNSWRLAQRQD